MLKAKAKCRTERIDEYMPGKNEVIAFMREEAYRPMTLKDLMEAFDISFHEKEIFEGFLRQMELEGKVVKTRMKRYGVPERMNLAVGKIQGHPKGFAFLLPDDRDTSDVYITRQDLNGAMHDDYVVVRVYAQTSPDKRREGEVIRILKRANQRIVGVYERSRKFGFVIPANKRIVQDIYIDQSDSNGAKDGQVVEVEIMHWPEKRRNPEGKIVEIIGNQGDPGTDIEVIIRKYDLPQEFSQDVIDEAEAISQSIPPEEIKRRQDLRDVKMVTIDGADAKDLDDAVSIERLQNGHYKLGVHIADVSFYVKEGSALNREALERATSVYLVDRVIPMLPKRLSNGICSLNAGEDRLSMSVFMEITPQGKVVEHEIFESVICVDERLTYEDVTKMLEEDDQALWERYQHLKEEILTSNELAKVLFKRRINRGSIDFDFPEAKVVLNDKGEVLDLLKYGRTISSQIIEEFMLIANEVVAESMFWQQVPFIYRIHENPDETRVTEFNDFLHGLGYHLKGTHDIHPKALQELLQKVEGQQEEKLINTVMLRSLKQAKYSASHEGHFGLAAVYYSHFTSPIRRYPDLMIHRIIREWKKKGRLSKKKAEYWENHLPVIAQVSSERERRAVEAERETVELKQMEFMQDQIGEEFEGIISGLANYGMYVELENLVEGLVHVSTMLDDYYHYHDKKFALIGERTGKTYRIGDMVKVRLERINLDERKLDFVLL